MKYKIHSAGKETKKSIFVLLSMACLVAITFSACKKDNNDNNDPYDRIKPKGPKPEWAPTILLKCWQLLKC